jgi:hypothetical protein
VLTRSELEALGYRDYGRGYEAGWYDGQNDNPQDIYDRLKDDYDVVFSITGKGQFDTHFEAWVKEREAE